jgi:hypothetical protein
MPDRRISPPPIMGAQVAEAEIQLATFTKPTAHERRQAVIGALVWG